MVAVKVHVQMGSVSRSEGFEKAYRLLASLFPERPFVGDRHLDDIALLERHAVGRLVAPQSPAVEREAQLVVLVVLWTEVAGRWESSIW